MIYFAADVNAIAKIYGKEVVKNNESFMSIEKIVVDFVMKGARFKVKDQGHQQLSMKFGFYYLLLFKINNTFHKNFQMKL